MVPGLFSILFRRTVLTSPGGVLLFFCSRNSGKIVKVYLWSHAFYNMKEKQSARGALIKRCSENVQQIYRRTPMSKCDFNKFALQTYWNRLSAWVSSCKFAAKNTLLQEHLWKTTSDEKHDKRRYSHTIYFLSEIYKYYFYFSTWKTIKNISSYHLYCVFTVWSERWKEVIFMKD